MKDKSKIEGKENATCKICGNGTRILHDGQMGAIYHVCGSCQYIFRDEDEYITKDEEKTRYLEHDNSYENEGYRDFLEGFLKEAVFPYAENIVEALDFGSGPEPVLARIMKEDYGIGTDIYDLHFATDKASLGKQYDLVVSTEVLEHLKDPVETMKILSGCMKPGGLLAIMTLFHYADDESFLRWHYRRDRTHIGFFTPKTLEMLGELAGLKLIKTDGKRSATFKK